MEFISTLLLFTLVAVGVSVVGVVLTSSSDKLGAAYQLQRSVTGFIILAAATSLPELIVSCRVARKGAVEMAVGSLLGSCLINLLILAAIDLSRRTRSRMFSRTSAAHSLSALASILLAAIVAACVVIPDMPTLGPLHSGSFLLFLGYLLTVRLVTLDQFLSGSVASSDETHPKVLPTITSKKWALISFLGAATGLLLLSTPLANSSDKLASELHMSGTFFGAVFLAFITSLPEAITTYEAARRDACDMAIGNILGSNAFNLLILVAVDFCTPGPLFNSLGPVHAVAAIGVIVTTTIAAMGLLYRVEKRIWYLEPDAVGVILVAMLFFYIVYVLD